MPDRTVEDLKAGVQRLGLSEPVFALAEKLGDAGRWVQGKAELLRRKVSGGPAPVAPRAPAPTRPAAPARSVKGRRR